MPLALSKLKKETKPLFFYVGDEETADNTVNFLYKPNEFTPGLEDRFKNASESELKSDGFLDIIASLVVSWDVYDVPETEGGKPISFRIEPTTAEGDFLVNTTPGFRTNYIQLKEVPSVVYSKLLDAIVEDQKPKKEQPTGSLIG